MSRIRIGTSGFRYPEWRPGFYPADLPEKEFLRFYASRFSTVELDSTFYRMPTGKTIDGWKAATAEDFEFTLKASQQITHRERLEIPSDALNYLMRIVPRLQQRLGLVLFQLPPFLRCDEDLLKAFLSELPRGIRCAFEFRHDSWFQAGTYDLLREHDAALCIHDADDHTTPLEVTAPFTCLRLRRSGYDAPLRDDWRHRMREWADRGLDVFAYLKHEGSPDAPLLARDFAEGLDFPAPAVR
jgi:uncharacterized protein YecE (DUF72 family)